MFRYLCIDDNLYIYIYFELIKKIIENNNQKKK